MAVTSNSYTGNGSTTLYSFTFPYISTSDIKVTLDGTATTQYSYANATQIQFASAPGNNVAIKIFRETESDETIATFYPGSAIRAADLNNNSLQNLYVSQEVINEADAATTAATTATTTATNATNTANTATTTANNATTTANSAVTTANAATATANTASTNATNAVNTANSAASSAASAASTASAAQTTATNTASQFAGLQASAWESGAETVDSTETFHTSDDTKIATSKAIEARIDAKIDTALTSDVSADTAVVVTDNSPGSGQIKIGLDNKLVELSTMTSAAASAIADLSHTEVQILDGATLSTGELNKLDGVSSSTAELNILTGVTSTAGELNILDGVTASTNELNILDGVTATAAEINKVDGLTSSTTDLNQLQGKTVTTSFNSSNTNDIPTSSAINSHVVNLLNSLGGFVAIADDQSFPNANPDPSDNAGTVVSIANAGGLVIDSGGSTTTGRTLGSSTVTITGFPTSLRSQTLAADLGLQVQTTSTLNTYTYHKLIAKEADINQLSNDVNDFAARYRVGSSNPTTNLDSGDLFFNTTSGKMLVYDGTTSAWEEVQAIGSFNSNTLSTSGNTGGGASSFNGTAYRFGLSSAPPFAQQILCSINGVIQKPNAGTSQPSEGFALDGSEIIFSDAPPSGADFFIISIGTSVGIGTPSDNTVSGAKLQNLAVTGDKIATNLDLADNKKIRFGTGNDFYIQHDGTNTDLAIANAHNVWIKNYADGANEALAAFRVNGSSELYYDGSKKFETTNLGVKFSGYLQGNDGNHIRLGTSDDFNFYHSGNENIVDCANGHQLHLKYGSEHLAKFIPDGAVQLYEDGNLRFYTRSNGCTVDGTSTQSSLDFRTANAYRGSLYADNNNDIGFLTSTAAWRFKVANSGAVTIYDNLIVPAGKGIDFSAQTATSETGATTTAELLDHYEEGSWTPVLRYYSGGWHAATLDTAGTIIKAHYTRVGRMVTATFDWSGFQINSGTLAYAAFHGLPFQTNSAGLGVSCFATCLSNEQDQGLWVANGNTVVEFYRNGTSWNNWTSVANSRLQVSLQYQCA